MASISSNKIYRKKTPNKKTKIVPRSSDLRSGSGGWRRRRRRRVEFGGFDESKSLRKGLRGSEERGWRWFPLWGLENFLVRRDFDHHLVRVRVRVFPSVIVAVFLHSLQWIIILFLCLLLLPRRTPEGSFWKTVLTRWAGTCWRPRYIPTVRGLKVHLARKGEEGPKKWLKNAVKESSARVVGCSWAEMGQILKFYLFFTF